MTDDLSITSASLVDDGQSLQLRIVVNNPANRTRHVHGSMRAFRYDAATTTLSIQMSDHGLAEPRDLRSGVTQATFTLPVIVQVESASEAEISLRLPRTVTRVDPSQTGGDVLKLASLPIYQATTVNVELGWSEQPFYHDPRRPYELRKQLADWSTGRAKHAFTREARRPAGPVRE